MHVEFGHVEIVDRNRKGEDAHDDDDERDELQILQVPRRAQPGEGERRPLVLQAPPEERLGHDGDRVLASGLFHGLSPSCTARPYSIRLRNMITFRPVWRGMRGAGAFARGRRPNISPAWKPSSSRCTAAGTISSCSTSAPAARLHAGARRGARRPAHRASAATSSSPSSRRRRAAMRTPSCASATPTAPKRAPAATRRAAWPTCCSARTGRRIQVIRTVAGNLPAEVLADGRVTVDMGPARLDWRDIPLAAREPTRCICRCPGRPGRGSRWATRTRPSSSPDAETPPVDALGPGAGARRALPRARQYRLRPGARAGPHPAARLGARGRAHPRLRLRRLRGAGQRASPRAHRPPCRR